MRRKSQACKAKHLRVIANYEELALTGPEKCQSHGYSTSFTLAITVKASSQVLPDISSLSALHSMLRFMLFEDLEAMWACSNMKDFGLKMQPAHGQKMADCLKR